MRKLSALFAAFTVGVALFGAVGSAQASKVEYTRTGNNLDITVTNDTLPSPVSSFDIWFGTTVDLGTGLGLNFINTADFTNVTDGSAPAGWASAALAPSALDTPWTYTGYVDTGSPNGPIGVGDSLGGFSTTVTMADTASLDGLWFNLYDANFNTLDSGFTTFDTTVNPPGAVPEPGTLMLVGAGLGGLLLYRRKRA